MSEKFIEEHQGKVNDIAIYGQESNQTTYRLCRMNLVPYPLSVVVEL